MADMLEDLGETITDRTLVLNVIRGLNERFKTVGMHLRRGRPFPTFVDAKADLLLEEMTMEHHSTQATALAASTVPPRAPTSATGGSGSGGAAASQGGSSAPPAKSRRSRGGGKGSGGQGSSGQTSGGQGSQSGTSSTAQNRTTPSWPSFYNPWTGTIQMWPGPRPPLAPLPTRPPQQAMLAQQHSQPPVTPRAPMEHAGQWSALPPGFFPSTVGPSSWDQQSLASTFSTMALNQPQ